ncbi:DUF115 domain-containing protein [Geovibrio thiophilus]|uniref:DUF115 domain-containing protein n=1 Tax=Geovibrio thiophilus TaxID=139438 RepID=A0A3R5XZ19_9BACT|nr:6-hydroxymethylpterin diphosphokinase MptE-like protein [Geovibrio thiophilus]QAR34225.1 DUF115 domain-containing protein [Geovibrio thiophilus]
MIKQKNMQALKERRPELHSMVMNTARSTKYRLMHSEHPKRYPNLVNNSNGMLFYDNRDPLAASRKLITDKKINVPTLSVFLGMGLLYNLMNYMDMFRLTDASFIVIENDPELFALVVEYIDIEKYIRDERVYFVIGKKPEELYPIMNSLMNLRSNKFFAKAINYIEEPAAFVSAKDYYLGAVRTMNDAVKEVMLFYGNDPLDSLIGIDHTFVNIKEIIEYPGISDLKDKFSGRPGIVVATGPSLNKNIHLLEGLYDKAVICAVDASVRVMKRHGFKPHLTTSLERVEATSKLFEGLDEEDVKDIFLAACPVVHPLTYENFKGERIVVYRNFSTFEWLDIPKGTLNIGPSSANMAFKVLEYIGCSPIILIGQDLAFGTDDITHATGSTYGEKEQQYLTHRKNLMVEGNYVPQIKTTNVWNTFRKFYMKDVAEFKGKVINATEGGAKIHGAELMTFAEAIEKHIRNIAPADIPQQIKSFLHKPDKTEVLDYYEKTLSKVQESISYCESTMKKFYDGYLKCMEYKEKVADPYKENGVYNHETGASLIKQTESLMPIFSEKTFFYILMHYVQAYYIRAMVEIQGIRAGHDKTEDKNNAIMVTMKDMLAVMVELIKKMLKLLHILRTVLEINLKKMKKENGED